MIERDIEAVLLDLDGTLVDTAKDITAALNTLLAEHKRATLTLADVTSMIGDGLGALVEKGFAATGSLPNETTLAAAKTKCGVHYEALGSKHSTLYPGVMASVQRLKGRGLKLAVCTNKPEQMARRLLDDLDLSTYLDAVVGGDTLTVKKPDGGHIEGTLKRLGVSKECAVMVGDSRNDVLAARNAGVPIVLVAYGYNDVPLEQLGADHVIGAFDQLPDLLGF